MNPKVMQFLKDLLTDRIDNVKGDALNLYTELIQLEAKNTFTFSLPFTGKNFSILLTDYEIIKSFVKQSQKINAIKHLRQTGKYITPIAEPYAGYDPYKIGLKEAKDFVEDHNWLS